MPLEKTNLGGYTSALASMRYRTIIPSAGLQQMGWDSRVTHIPVSVNRRTLLQRFDGASAVVFGKVAYSDNAAFQKVSPMLGLLTDDLRSRGVKVIADFSDDRLSDSARGAVDRQLAGAANMMVTSTAELAEVMRSVSTAPVRTITDPVEGVRQAAWKSTPFDSPAELIRLLWFGHWNKVSGLPRALEQLDAAAAAIPFSVVLVTAPKRGAEHIAQEFDRRWRESGSSCSFAGWSVEAVFKELQRCDAVIIPSDPYDPHNTVKSPNRFTEALWAGRFVIAHPLPAYRALANFGWVGEDLGMGLSFFAANPDNARDRIVAGQEHIALHFTPSVITESWRQAIMDALESR